MDSYGAAGGIRSQIYWAFGFQQLFSPMLYAKALCDGSDEASAFCGTLHLAREFIKNFIAPAFFHKSQDDSHGQQGKGSFYDINSALFLMSKNTVP